MPCSATNSLCCAVDSFQEKNSVATVGSHAACAAPEIHQLMISPGHKQQGIRTTLVPKGPCIRNLSGRKRPLFKGSGESIRQRTDGIKALRQHFCQGIDEQPGIDRRLAGWRVDGVNADFAAVLFQQFHRAGVIAALLNKLRLQHNTNTELPRHPAGR